MLGFGRLYLKVAALLVDGDDEAVDVGDELVTLGLPQTVSTLLQELHQHLLHTHTHIYIYTHTHTHTDTHKHLNHFYLFVLIFAVHCPVCSSYPMVALEARLLPVCLVLSHRQ